MAKACPIWAEIEVSARPDVLVQMNLSDTAHEHEGFAAASAQHLFKRLPVRVRHLAIPRAHAKSIGHAGVPSATHSSRSSAFSVEENDDDDEDDEEEEEEEDVVVVADDDMPASSR
jgi:hypothetical protein